MRIDILDYSGFCGGVYRALYLLDKAVSKNSGKTIYLLGPIVHNKLVNDKYTKMGVEIIKTKDLDWLKDGDIVVVSAHGISNSLREKMKRFNVIDTTCPFVLKNQNKIKESLHDEIIFIGKKKHSETIASCLDDERIKIVESLDDLKGFSSSNYGIVFNQTTFNIEKLEEIQEEIKKLAPNYKIVNTMCETQIKIQNFLKDVNPKYNCLIIVGDKDSNNAMSLYEISPYRKTHFVSNLEDVKNIKIMDYDDIIIMGSASTPKELLKEIRQYIKNNAVKHQKV